MESHTSFFLLKISIVHTGLYISNLPLGGLNAFYWYQIFTLDSAVVEAQKMLIAWRIPNYCNVSSYRNNIIKLMHCDETERRAQVCVSVRLF